jgi:ribonuclease G
MNPRVRAQFTGQGARVLHALEAQTGKSFHFEGGEGLALDHVEVTLEGTRDEVAERAMPFRVGDEVLVQIVEPHMYDDDAAVAKIDGYIISVKGGGKHLGDKCMVRILEAGRTAAVAAPLDENGEVADDGGEDGGEETPTARRRGRRGGRGRGGRAAAKAQAE